MIINVTQECISDGVQGDCTACPVAIAIHNAYGRPVDVFVNPYEIRIDDPRRPHVFCYALPAAAKDWIESFDLGDTLPPLSFNIPGLEAAL